jgi:hypothetical protein
MPLRFLLVLGFLSFTVAEARAAGIGVSIPLATAVSYNPDHGLDSTSRPLALNVSFPIKKNVAIGLLVDAYQSRFARNTVGDDLTESYAVPIGFLAEYYPLEGKFNPYFLGHIGPLFFSESIVDDADDSRSAFNVGPHLGFGVGASMRWPVTPLAEVRCMAGFPAGEFVSNMYVCGITAGLAVSF